jgi:hypothetical protein
MKLSHSNEMYGVSKGVIEKCRRRRPTPESWTPQTSYDLILTREIETRWLNWEAFELIIYA